MRVWWIIVPALALLLGLLAYGLTSDPREIPSPLIGKPFPELVGEDLQGRKVKLGGASELPKVVNIWASWCVSCRVEHEVLMRGAERLSGRIELVGINYKDELEHAQRWLQQRGDPYVWSFRDQSGRAGIELGVYGVPETFFVDRKGTIVHKHTGPLTDDALSKGVELIAKQRG